MRTKIVYVLVSTNEDIYLEQAFLSVYSLKRVTPDAHVTLVIDDVTERSLVGTRSQIRELVSEMIVEKRPEGVSAKFSASSMKTKVRELIEGDFLFIDTDTIINRDISVIDDLDAEIAAVPDAHVPFTSHFNNSGLSKLFSKLGFECKGNYYNTGVLYVKDTPNTRKLFSDWNESYFNINKKCIYDQPHFAFANSLHNMVQEISGDWNCQIQFGLKYLSSAYIIHYFASNFVKGVNEHPYKFMNKEVYRRIKEDGRIPDDILKMIESAPEQWNECTEVVGGKDVVLQHSRLMKIVRNIYYSKPSIFRLVESTLSFLARIR